MPAPDTALFVTDIDGTLLAEDASLPPRNLEALLRAQEAGVALALVTGRRKSTVLRERARLEGLRFRIAASNGAVVLGEDHATVEACLRLDWAAVDAIAAEPGLAHAHVLCITLPESTGGEADASETYLLTPHDRRWLTSATPWKPETHVAAERSIALGRPLLHVAVVLPTREEAERAEPVVREAFAGAAAVHTVKVPYGEGALLEAVPSGGKGNAVRHLVERLRISASRTGGVGDDMNDGALLDAVRHRYAVGGSVLAARRPDAVTVRPAAEAAVADALDRFLAEIGA